MNHRTTEEPSQVDRAPESGPKHQNRILRSTGAFLGLAALTFGGFKVIDKAFFEPSRERNAAEATIIEEMRTGERPTEVEEAVIVLRPGVVIRKQPEMTTDKPGMHNEERTLSGDKALVVDRPLIHMDGDGNKWIGFIIGEGEVEQPVDEDDEGSDTELPALTGLEVGKAMSWVNMGALGTQVNEETELPYLEVLPIPINESIENMFANIDSRGVVTFGFEDNIEEVAVAREIDAAAAEIFISSSAVQE